MSTQDPDEQPRYPNAPPPPEHSGQAGYGAMPPMPPAEAQQAPEPPTEVQAGFWGFLVSALIVLVSGLLIIGQRDQLADASRKAVRENGQRVSDAQLDTFVTASVITTIVIAVIIAGLYVLFAFKARAGRNWARIVLTIIAVLALIGLAFGGGGGSVLGIIGRVLAIASAVALYLPNSNHYFTAAKARR